MAKSVLNVVFIWFIGSLLPIKLTGQNAINLNGKWIPIRQEMGGKVLPMGNFKNQSLIIKDSTYTFSAESIDKGVVTYNDGKMDIFGKEGVNSGKHFRAIYKINNELLTVCYNLAGNWYPEEYDTSKSPVLFISIFRKEQTE